MNGTVSTLSIVFMAAAGVLSVCFPVALFVYFRRKKGADVLPFFVGCAVMLLFAFVLESLAHSVVLGSPAGAAIRENVWLYALYGGLMAGLFEETGRYLAFKTVLKKSLSNNANALMYGAGGISGVIGYELSKRGVRRLTIANRTPEKAESIAAVLRGNTPMEVEVISTEPDALDKAAGTAELLLNVTPLGSKGCPDRHPYLGFVDRMPKTAFVFDSVINPPGTETILAAEKNGLRTVPGMKMLVSQMDVIFRFLFGVELQPEHKAACERHMCDYLGVRL